MKSLVLAVAAVVGLTYSVKLGYDIDSSRYSRAHRYTYTVTGPATFADSEVKKRQYVAVKAELGPRWTPPTWPPKDHPPLRIVIGAHVWRVRYTTPEYLNATGSLAYSNMESQTIWLSNRDTPVEMRDSLVHEVMHAARWENGGAYIPTTWSAEDAFIQPTAPILAQVIHDNPKLIAWLAESGR
jgi:hypothetical protein